VRAYARALHHRPGAWALHNYDDVRSHTTSQLRAFQRVTRGPIWLTEISGVERRGHWQFKNQNSFAAIKDEALSVRTPKRSIGSPGIYHYQWQDPVAPGTRASSARRVAAPGLLPVRSAGSGAPPVPSTHESRRPRRLAGGGPLL